MFSSSSSKPKLKPEGGILLTLGKSLTIRGDIIGEEDLVIDGKIEGNVHIEDHHLTVAGIVEGNVSARQVTVMGQVRGNVLASELVELRETASVEGDVCSRRFSIEQNASLNGRIQTYKEDRKLELLQGAKQAPPAASPAVETPAAEPAPASAPPAAKPRVVHVKV